MEFFKSFLGMFSGIGKLLLQALWLVLFPFIFSCIVWLLYYLKCGRRFPARSVPVTSTKYSKPANLLKRLYVDLPRRFLDDKMTTDPDIFDTFGVHIFCGEQGSGKTVAMIHFIKQIMERNPACKLSSNIDISFQDGRINDWTDILNTNNGKYGQIVVLDEIQNWFSSNESKNFPPAMLSEITQQRKQRKIVVGTAQVFNRIAKPIREQITMIYKPLTVCGCFTIVRVYRPKASSTNGDLEKLHLVKTYCFVHDDEIRNSFDTLEKVKRVSVVGFQDRDKQLANNSPANITILSPKK